VGERFSIADIALFAYLHCAAEGGFDLQPFPALTRWLATIRARPAYLPIDTARSSGLERTETVVG
jgi:glutathione S-transferase